MSKLTETDLQRLSTLSTMSKDELPDGYFRSEKFIRMWAAHWGFRLRRRGARYSLYITYDNPAFPHPRVDCRTLGQVVRWLDKWGNDEIARLSRPRKTKQRKIDPWLLAIADGEAGDSCRMRLAAEAKGVKQ